jgi:hypothetical protein
MRRSRRHGSDSSNGGRRTRYRSLRCPSLRAFRRLDMRHARPPAAVSPPARVGATFRFLAPPDEPHEQEISCDPESRTPNFTAAVNPRVFKALQEAASSASGRGGPALSHCNTARTELHATAVQRARRALVFFAGLASCLMLPTIWKRRCPERNRLKTLG